MSKGALVNRRKARSKLRGLFVPLFHNVIKSREFAELNHAAVRLLVLVAAGYNGHNNGRLVACRKYLRKFGWVSNDSTTRCLSELVDAGLLVQTRMGARPNRAAWYAVTWWDLDVTLKDGCEIDPRNYRKFIGTPVGPIVGQGVEQIVPAVGQRRTALGPTSGTMKSEESCSLDRQSDRI